MLVYMFEMSSDAILKCGLVVVPGTRRVVGEPGTGLSFV